MISIIIPTLNAAPGLKKALLALDWATHADLIDEVIIADAGSSDATDKIAAEFGCRILSQSPKGRGQQLRSGAGVAKGQWLLFLHADTRLQPGWHRVVADFINTTGNNPNAAAFCFKLNDQRWQARLMERIVDFRNRWLKLPYGDQGLLISKGFYDEIGGFKDLPLMEDVDIIQRIGGKRLTILPIAAITSAKKYIKEGYARRSLRNLYCLSLWYLGCSMDRISRNYG